jgi:single-strand selective monofunctional uracil DNA glycosylase
MYVCSRAPMARAQDLDLPQALITVTKELSRAVTGLSFAAPVTHVYNPLAYAWEPHANYLRAYGRTRKEVLLLGMNPGPFGMAQTGVPFGDVGFVRDFLGVQGKVGVPEHPHPKRPVEGFACPRGEVSGQRLWGWVKTRFGSPSAFFERFFVVNYCPLVFVEPPAKNRTPDKLPPAERAPLFAACDAALRAYVDVLRPTHVVGVGAFAEKRAREALAGTRVLVSTILHPSPASPLANTSWAPTIEAQLRAAGIALSAR